MRTTWLLLLEQLQHVSGTVMHELALLTTVCRAGAGESGKSTVLKQMKLIYAQGFSKNERLEWKPVVFNNVVQSIRLIFDVMNDQSIEFENKGNEVRGSSARARGYYAGCDPVTGWSVTRFLAT